MANAQRTAPLTVRNFDRIVALQDYADFARSFGGIGKADVKLFPVGARRILHLTIASSDGVTPSDAHLITSLSDAINRYRISPSPPVYIHFCEILRFSLRAELYIDPSINNADAILRKAQKRLARAFAFDKRELGQAVAASEIVAQLQRIAGVISVTVTRLSVSPRTTEVRPVLFPETAHVDGHTIKPGQLLLLDPVFTTEKLRPACLAVSSGAA
jgi:phage-related baseplate assembly protein